MSITVRRASADDCAANGDIATAPVNAVMHAEAACPHTTTYAQQCERECEFAVDHYCGMFRDGIGFHCG